MKVLQLFGRILFGGLFVVNGLNHFLSLDAIAGYAGAKGVPLPTVVTIVTGAMIILGGLSVILGYQRKIGLWLLVIFLIPVAFIIHDFWAVGAEQRMAQMQQFFKNLALAGAALTLLPFADSEWPLSLGRWTSKLDNAMPGPEAGPSGGNVQGGGAAGPSGLSNP